MTPSLSVSRNERVSIAARGPKISFCGLEISFNGQEIRFCDQLTHHELPRCLRMSFGLPLAYAGIP